MIALNCQCWYKTILAAAVSNRVDRHCRRVLQGWPGWSVVSWAFDDLCRLLRKCQRCGDGSTSSRSTSTASTINDEQKSKCSGDRACSLACVPGTSGQVDTGPAVVAYVCLCSAFGASDQMPRMAKVAVICALLFGETRFSNDCQSTSMPSRSVRQEMALRLWRDDVSESTVLIGSRWESLMRGRTQKP
ncbi:hypothetical protein MRB53_037024 [Persea americana]|nr:hypothetical protein MRB53_037024 [Persea americana]